MAERRNSETLDHGALADYLQAMRERIERLERDLKAAYVQIGGLKIILMQHTSATPEELDNAVHEMRGLFHLKMYEMTEFQNGE